MLYFAAGKSVNNSQETGDLLLCISRDQSVSKSSMTLGDFPGGPVAKNPHSQCWGPRFNPWLGTESLHAATRDPACCN